MLKIPIAKQLKKRQQIEIATLQDEIVDIAYSTDENLVFHGGTAIWRCYSGKRFSEDLDFYSTSFSSRIDEFIDKIKANGLSISKAKDTGNVIFLAVTNNRAIVKFEVSHDRKVQGTSVTYELVDGSSVEILSLTREELISEKILAYSDRRFIRDLYDIFHLTKDPVESDELKKQLLAFCQNLPNPVDESILKSIVYSGLPPSFDRMRSEIIRSTK